MEIARISWSDCKAYGIIFQNKIIYKIMRVSSRVNDKFQKRKKSYGSINIASSSDNKILWKDSYLLDCGTLRNLKDIIIKGKQFF